MIDPFPPTALRRRHAQMVRDSLSSYKIDYAIVIKIFLNRLLVEQLHREGSAPAACAGGFFLNQLQILRLRIGPHRFTTAPMNCY